MRCLRCEVCGSQFRVYGAACGTALRDGWHMLELVLTWTVMQQDHTRRPFTSAHARDLKPLSDMAACCRALTQLSARQVVFPLCSE